MANELVLDGGIWKFRAKASTSALEYASYDAAATAAKTLAHGTLVKVTSTELYYKIWKTGGPGIPVPLDLYEDIQTAGGYASNASGNAYFTLEDDEDNDSDLTNRGWVPSVTAGAAPVLTKTANNPITLGVNVTSGWDNSKAQISFTTSTARRKYLLILDIHSYVEAANWPTHVTGVGNFMAMQDSSNNRFVFYNSWSRTYTIGYFGAVNKSPNFFVRYTSSDWQLFRSGAGPTNQITSGWIYYIYSLKEDDLSEIYNPTLTDVQHVFPSERALAEAGISTNTTDVIGMQTRAHWSGASKTLEYKINEAHFLKL